jgi:DNA-binding transcriptional LysR family regulator
MTFDEIRTFLEVVEAGSLVAAARRLNVTQSTITARINSLEDEVGQKLLHRNKSGTELTSPGFKFKRYAELMSQLWNQARMEVSLPTGFQAVCNVGLEYDLWEGIGQRFLDHVREESPGVAIAVWPGEQRQIDRWLNTGLIDLAFCYAPQAGEKFANRVLLDDEIILVSSKRMARPQYLDSYIYVDHGDEFRRQHAAAYPADVSSAVTIASSAWALDEILRRGGAGYVPLRHAAPLLQKGRIYEVKSAPRFNRRIYVVETTQATRSWDWYESALEAAKGH